MGKAVNEGKWKGFFFFLLKVPLCRYVTETVWDRPSSFPPQSQESLSKDTCSSSQNYMVEYQVAKLKPLGRSWSWIQRTISRVLLAKGILPVSSIICNTKKKKCPWESRDPQEQYGLHCSRGKPTKIINPSLFKQKSPLLTKGNLCSNLCAIICFILQRRHKAVLRFLTG